MNYKLKIKNAPNLSALKKKNHYEQKKTDLKFITKKKSNRTKNLVIIKKNAFYINKVCVMIRRLTIN